jgi:hypothetical protein
MPDETSAACPDHRQGQRMARVCLRVLQEQSPGQCEQLRPRLRLAIRALIQTLSIKQQDREMALTPVQLVLFPGSSASKRVNVASRAIQSELRGATCFHFGGFKRGVHYLPSIITHLVRHYYRRYPCRLSSVISSRTEIKWTTSTSTRCNETQNNTQ